MKGQVRRVLDEATVMEAQVQQVQLLMAAQPPGALNGNCSVTVETMQIGEMIN